jgi:uroporphyrinogen decarboxylase
MRQAGRYMANYRALRQRYSLLDICAQPELAVEVTLQPLDAIDVDAAILFSDLLLPFTPMGLDFDFVKGEGPPIDVRGGANRVLDSRRRARRSAVAVRASRRAVARPRDHSHSARPARGPRSANWLRRCPVHDGRVCH